ncbi:ABC transporter substrate binding protein [Candidatus Haliotispira prima]|uniref:ABC transporter substrate binding protein n=1 Tax=Candidatus Haliotispira prima TaxID=3034016 RepID=A0ABY8MFG6_9SPIO|nr:ABC transporter substrate binding protein [Candidatus Haliotispira prima]
MNEKRHYFGAVLFLAAVIAIGCKKEPVYIGLAKYNASPSNNLLADRIMAIVSEKHPEVVFESENGEGDTEKIEQISAAFAGDARLQLRIAIDGPIAERFAEDAGAPIIYAGVTDPESAGLLSGSNQITGYSDAVSVENAFFDIMAMMPELDNLGQIESANESNSQYIKGVIRYRSALAGINSVKTTLIRNVGQISDAVSALVSTDARVDALYLANSSDLFENVGTIVQIANRNLVPIFSSDPVSSAGTGVMFSYGANYHKMAEATADLIIRYIEAQAEEEKEAIFARNVRTQDGDEAAQVYVDEEVAKKFGVTVPEYILAKAGTSATATPPDQGAEQNEAETE